MATSIEPRKVQTGSRSRLSPGFLAFHIAALVIVGLGVVVMGGLKAIDLSRSAAVAPSAEKIPTAPVFPEWAAFPVQHRGRHKPFETACDDVMREIAGREKVHRQPASAVILMWMFGTDPDLSDPKRPWDDVPFILCEHRELRKFIYTLGENGQFLDESNLSHEQKYGKYISPNDLTRFFARLDALKDVDPAKYRAKESALKNEIGSVRHRHGLYRRLCQLRMPLETIAGTASRPYIPVFAVVALDKVPHSAWFSIDELRLLDRHPEVWAKLMERRVREAPQFYLKKQHRDKLEEFQRRIQAGEGSEVIDELEAQMKAHREAVLRKYREYRAKKNDKEATRLLTQAIRTWMAQRDRREAENLLVKRFPEFQRVNLSAFFLVNEDIRTRYVAKHHRTINEDASRLQTLLEERDAETLEQLRQQLPSPSEYAPSHPKWQMLHMSYLEAAFPNLYREVLEWQLKPGTEEPLPEVLAAIRRVLGSFDAAGKAYRSGDRAAFVAASEKFFAVVREVSESVAKADDEGPRPYPGESTIADRIGNLVTGTPAAPPSQQLLDMELTFKHVRPFMWAWVFMLLASIAFAVSLAVPHRLVYWTAFLLGIVSLAFQSYGFFVRIVISGRAPVSNMYETVIWVAFMAGIFALILEAIFRSRVIGLAGCLVSTLGLVLADQLPLALNPAINPLVPVLRSNFWLTIHVLTIVSSYGAGTLAWGLGNISLAMIVFGKGSQSTIKMLSNFIYRTLQIAVILLAAGTFLGGWWAAYSWGRFWGWDAKENGALIALLCYVIPLHMRYVGWLKDFGMAVAAILCYAAIIFSWYMVNFVFPAGLHSYGFGGGGAGWVYLIGLINIEWVLAASLLYRWKRARQPA